MRQNIKRLMEGVLVNSHLYKQLGWNAKADAIVLLYHNVVPESYMVHGEQALHIGVSDFIQQIDWLRHSFPIVPLSAIQEQSASPRTPKVVITFDDAYKGALNLGIPVLLQRDIPSTIFAAPGLLGQSSTWWDIYSPHLQRPVGERKETFRDIALSVCNGDKAEVDLLAQKLGFEAQELGIWESIASADELASLAKNPLVTVGAHSWTHRSLANLPPDSLAEELIRPLEWFRRQGIEIQPWIAYPYGLTTPEAVSSARDHGYTMGLAASGGCVWKESPPDMGLLPRVNIGRGVSRNGFWLRLHGVIPR